MAVTNMNLIMAPNRMPTTTPIVLNSPQEKEKLDMMKRPALNIK